MTLLLVIIALVIVSILCWVFSGNSKRENEYVFNFHYQNIQGWIDDIKTLPTKENKAKGLSMLKTLVKCKYKGYDREERTDVIRRKYWAKFYTIAEDDAKNAICSNVK